MRDAARDRYGAGGVASTRTAAGVRHRRPRASARARPRGRTPISSASPRWKAKSPPSPPHHGPHARDAGPCPLRSAPLAAHQVDGPPRQRPVGDADDRRRIPRGRGAAAAASRRTPRTRLGDVDEARTRHRPRRSSGATRQSHRQGDARGRRLRAGRRPEARGRDVRRRGRDAGEQDAAPPPAFFRHRHDAGLARPRFAGDPDPARCAPPERSPRSRPGSSSPRP